MPIPAALKQTHSKAHTLIKSVISILLDKIAITKLRINIIKKEPPKVAGMPLFTFGSFTSNFKSLIHRFEKSIGEYHKDPKTK